ncbi:MAG: exodeoxyribonuclease III [Akkermansia muciniphila]|nr:exodeoxyribonuclease III [Akkermansia muciniphila]
MKLVSWNVNGLRAILGKGMGDAVEALEPDVLCLQEIKARPEQVNDLWISSWPHQLWNPAEKAGYSGVLILSRVQPLSTSTGIGWPEHDREGRVCTMEFEQFYLVNCYTPNSQNELVRLPYREQWDAAFRKYVAALAETKPVVFCGDLNVAHNEIDLKNPKTNRRSAGFTDEERGKFTELLGAGFVDTFRYFYPEQEGIYSWWSYRFKAREKNAGWRIDYYVVSARLQDKLVDAKIHTEVLGSDHCPVELEINL